MDYASAVLTSATQTSPGRETPGRNGRIREKIDAAVSMLLEEGHTVRSFAARGGWPWFEIDGTRLASWLQMQRLADGSETLSEIEELF